MNSTIDKDPDNSTTVTNWTFNPAADSFRGWKQDNVLIYGENLFIDRLGTHTATPTLSTTPCANLSKVVKFYYNAGNTGSFTFNVNLGGSTIATFKEWGLGAGSVITRGPGVTSSIIDRRFISEGPISGDMLWNNVWHEVTLYVPGYTSGNLSFEYIRNGGISRQVRLDNVQLYEAVPTPVPASTSVTTTSCDAKTFNLTTLNPSSTQYTYSWYLDPSATQPVVNATAVPPGTYYLFQQSTCNTGCLSYASKAVSVNLPAGCCGGNLISNSTFNNGTTGWTLNSNASIATPDNYRTVLGGSAIAWKTPPTDNWIKFYAPFGESDGSLSTTIKKLCPETVKTLKFDFVVNETSSLLDRRFTVSLGGNELFHIWANSYSPYNMEFRGIRTGVTLTRVREDGETTGTMYQYSDNSIIPKLPWKYTVTVTIAPTAGISGENLNLNFQGYKEVNWFIDNVTLVEELPVAQIPTAASGSSICPSPYFNLRTVEPLNAYYKYQWHTTATIGSPLVADPTKVTSGTYYMETISVCSGCSASSYVPFTVNSNCPTISGKVYADYDGPAANGISNPANLGASGGGLYAHLVNSTGVVINSVRIKSDGTYSLTGLPETVLRIIIHRDSVPNGGTLNASQLNPNYVHTGDVVGGTTGSTTNDGISATFSLTANQILTNVNFGIQSPPIASDASATLCHPGEGTAYTIPALYGVDDDPAWNNGVGQKIIIQTLQTTNGTLIYNGTPVTPLPYTIASYDPNLLVFQITGPEAASVQFTYVFLDKAGSTSLVPGTVRYDFQAVTPPPTGNTIQYFCTAPSPTHYVSELVVTGTNIKWYNSAGDLITSPATTVLVDGITYYATQTLIDPNAGTSCESQKFPVTVDLTNAPVITAQPIGYTICLNDNTAFPLNISAGGTGTITYQWYRNTANSNTGGELVGTGPSYTPVTTTAGTLYYYAVVTSSNCGTTTSEVVAITVTENCCGLDIINNGSFSGSESGWTLTRAWKYAKSFDGHDGVVTGKNGGTVEQITNPCAGEPYRLSFWIQGLPANNWLGAMRISYGGTVLFDIQLTNVLNITNVASALGGSIKVDGVTHTAGTTYSGSTWHYFEVDIPGNLVTTNALLQFYENYAGVTWYLDGVSLISQPPTAPVLNATSSYICTGTTFNLNQSTVYTAQTGYSYNWYTSAGTMVANPAGVSPGTYYLRRTSNCTSCESANSVPFTVSANEVRGGTVATDQIICTQGDPVAITTTTASTGTGALTYQWQSGTVSCTGTFANIAGATGESYDPGPLTQTTFFRRIVTSTITTTGSVIGSSCQEISNCVTVTVYPDPQITVQPAPKTVCRNAAASLNVTVTGGYNNTYQWQSSSDNATWTNIAGATASTYSPPTATSGRTYYRVVVSSATKGCDQVISSSALIFVIYDPVLTGPATVTDGTDPDKCSRVVSYDITATADPAPTVTYRIISGPGLVSGATSGTGTGSGSDFKVGTTRVQITASNGCTDAFKTVDVTVNDTQLPTINCNTGNITIQTKATDTGCGTVYDTPDPSFSDNCPGSSLSYSIVFPDGTTRSGAGVIPATQVFPVGTSTITYTATDVAGNNIPCSYTITVTDNTPPTITCPVVQPQYLMDADKCYYTGTFAATVQDNCTASGDLTIAYSVAGNPITFPYQFSTGSTLVNVTVTDQAGNSNVCDFTVNVADKQPPALICPVPETFYENDPDACGKQLTFTATATDNCTATPLIEYLIGTAKITFPHTFPVGSTDVKVVAADAAGNTSNCTFTVNVRDTQKPVITCPEPVTVNVAFDNCTATAVLGTPTVSDNCPLPAGAVSNDAPEVFPLGTTLVTWTVTDASGNQATCTQQVTVQSILAVNSDNMVSQTVCTGTPATALSVTASGLGTLTYQWYRSTTTEVNTETATMVGTNTNSYTPLTGTPGTFYYYVIVSDNCASDTSAVASVSVNGVTGGAVSGDQSICTGDDPAAFTQITAATASGTLTYQWQSSTTGCEGVFTDIEGATAATYNIPSGLTLTTYYRRVSTSTLNGVACTATSNCLTVTVYEMPTQANAGPDITECNVSTFTMSANTPVVGTGTWTVVSGPATITDPASPTTTVQLAAGQTATLRWSISNGPCLSSNDGVILTNYALPVIELVSGNTAQVICRNEPVGNIVYHISGSATGAVATGLPAGVTASYDPQTKLVTISGTPVVSGAATFTYTVTTTSPCDEASLTGTIQVKDLPMATISGGSEICVGGSAQVTLTGSMSVAPYTFIYTINGGAEQSVTAGSNSVTVNVPSTTVGTFTYMLVSVTANGCTNTATGSTTIKVVADPTITSHPTSQTVCLNEPVNVSVSATGGTPSLAYQWESSANGADFTAISGANQPSYTVPTGSVATMYYRAVVTATGGGCNPAVSQIATVVVNEAPVFTACPSNITVEAGNGACTAAVSYTATVSGTPAPTVTYQFTGATTGSGTGTGSGATFNVGVTAIILRAINTCDEVTCTFTVTVLDTQLPSLTCPGNLTYYVGSNCQAQDTLPSPVYSDNCGVTTLTWSVTLNGAPYANSGATGINIIPMISGTVGEYVVTYTAKDASNNQAQCSFTVSLVDTISPTIICPEPVSLFTDPGQCYASNVMLGTPVTSDNCGGSIVSLTNDAPAQFPKGNTTVTWTVTDVNGNTATCTQQVTVTDNQPPVITNCPDSETLEGCNIDALEDNNRQPYSEISVEVTAAIFTAAGGEVHNNCTEPMRYFYSDVFTPGCSTTITRTWVVMDAANNQTDCVQEITISNTNSPIIAEADGSSTVNCMGAMTTPVPPSGNSYCGTPITPRLISTEDFPTTGGTVTECEGTRVYTFEYKDCAGNTAYWKYTYTLQRADFLTLMPKNTARTVDCVSEIFVPSAPVVRDGCGRQISAGPVQISPANYASLPCYQGDVVFTYTYTDCAGRYSHNWSHTVTVANQQPPTGTRPADLTLKCKADIPVANPNAMTGLTGQCSNESITVTVSDQNNGGAGCAASPYIVNRTFTLTDCSGQTNSYVQTITVIDDVKPVFSSCPPDMDVNAETGQTYATVTIPDPVVTDGCSGTVTLSYSMTGATTGSGTLVGTQQFILGDTRITYIAQDVCGNTQTCVFVITVNDADAPIMSCPPDINVECINEVPGPYSSYAAYLAAGGTATDNDGVDTATFSWVEDIDDLQTCPKTIQRFHTIADVNGNWSRCQQNIIVDDQTPPAVSGTLDTIWVNGCSVADKPAPVTTEPELESLGISVVGNCTPVENLTVTSQDTYTGSCPIQVTRVYTLRDACDNVTEITQIIYIQDTTAPVIAITSAFPSEFRLEGCSTDAFASQAQSARELMDRYPGAIDISDNCASVEGLKTSINDVVTGTCPIVITRTYTFTDQCGNSASIMRPIYIEDTTRPVVTNELVPLVIEDCSIEALPAPATTAAELEGMGLNIQDNCTPDNELLITYSDDEQTGTCPITVIRTYRIEDKCTNSVEKTQFITIDDTQSPIVGTAPATRYIEGCNLNALTGPVYSTTVAVSSYSEFSDAVNGGMASDGCGITRVTYSDVSSGTCPIVVTRTWHLEDVCGNVTNTQQRIYIDDTSAPEITGSFTATNYEGCDINAAPPATTVAGLEALGISVNDQCTPDASLVVRYSQTVTGTCPITVTRTYQITDICGNSSSIVHNFTIDDTTPPVITGTLPIQEINGCGLADLPQPAMTVTNLELAGLSISDNCTGDNALTVSLVSETMTGTCPRVVTHVKRITDQCGNYAEFTRVYHLIDNEPPVLTGTLPTGQNGIHLCFGEIPAGPTEAEMAALYSDLCGGTLKVTKTGTPTGDNCAWSVNYTYQIEDECGNSVSPSPVVTYSGGENDKPELVDATNTPVGESGLNGCYVDATTVPVVVPAFNPANIVPFYKTHCGLNVQAVLVNTTVSGNNCNWTVDYEYKMVDACGNELPDLHIYYSGSDQSAPTGTAPAGLTDVNACYIDAVTPPSPTVAFNANTVLANYSDGCGTASLGILNLVTQVTGNDCAWTLTYTYDVADDCGNVLTGQTIIHSGYNSIPPSFTKAPNDLYVSCTRAIPEPHPADYTANSACGDAATVSWVSDAIVDSVCANRYTLIRTYKATDNCNNETVITKRVYVNDLTAPVITSIPADITVSCAADVPEADISAVSYTENCGETALVTVDEDVITNQVTPNQYTISRTYRAEDACGNISARTQTITVNDQTAPLLTCPANVTVPVDAGTCTAAAVSLGTPTYSDNCGEVSVTNNAPASFPVGVTEVTWTAADQAGNVTTCVQLVTVRANNTISSQPLASQTICQNAVPAALSVTATGTAPFTYQWYVNTTASTTGGSPITGATGSTYTPEGPFTADRHYYVAVVDNCGGRAVSTVSSLYINRIVAATIASDLTICYGVNPPAFTNATSSVGRGPLTYQWEQSTDNGATWENIPGATTALYDPPSLTQTTSFRKRVFSTFNGVVCDDVSNAVAITVNPETEIPVVAVANPTCGAAGSAGIQNFVAGATYTFTPAGPAVDASGNITGIAVNTEYSVTATLNGCAAAGSTTFTLSNALLDCDGDGVNADVDPDDTNPCIPNQTATPVVSSTNPTCGSVGSAQITNYQAGTTYTFTPVGPAVDSYGNITGFELNTGYSVVATGNNCNSVENAQFIVSNAALDCDGDGVSADEDPDDTDPCNPNQTVTPVVSTVNPTCDTQGSAQIDNFVLGTVYTFIPAGPSVDASGIIIGFNLNETYSVSAAMNNCTSTGSASFAVSNAHLDCDGDGIPADTDPDDNDPCNSRQTATPVIAAENPTCISAGTARIANFEADIAYLITPAGPVVDETGIISGFLLNTEYSVSATRNNCTSPENAVFTISNTLLDCDSDGVTADEDPDDKNPCVPSQTADPVVVASNPTCETAGTAIISNFTAGTVYTFQPAGSVVDEAGNITGFVLNTQYYVTATRNNCSSVENATFTVSNAELDCDNDNVTADEDPDDNNPCIPNQTPDPQLAVTQPTCTVSAMAYVSNFVPGTSYMFTPEGPRVDGVGNILDHLMNTTYTVTASLNGCVSTGNSSFALRNNTLDCDGDGITADADPDDTNPCVPNQTETPVVAVTNPTCTAAGEAQITNYTAGTAYVFTPAGPAADAAGNITGFVLNTEYAVTAMLNNCASVGNVMFTVSNAQLDCDGDGIPADTDPDDNDPCNSNQTADPQIAVTNPTCEAAGTVQISNYVEGTVYTFTPAGPMVDATGSISGFTLNTSYSVSSTLKNCTSIGSATFTVSNAALDCDGDGVPANEDPDDTEPCNPNQTATPVLTVVNPTCTAIGTVRIDNHITGTVYTFNPAGPVVDLSGNITGFTLNTEYTVTASLYNCISTGGATFSVSNAALDCDGDGVPASEDPDDTDPCNPNQTEIPVVAIINPTCGAVGTAQITNYQADAVYTFTPAGPAVDASGNITGFTLNTEYTVSATRNNCTSVDYAAFTVSSTLLDCDGDGVTADLDPDDNDPCNPNNVGIPQFTLLQPNCNTPQGSASVSNFDANATYVFNPAGPAVSVTGSISAYLLNQTYAVTAVSHNCTSEAASFSLSNTALDCDGDGVTADADTDDLNPCVPNQTADVTLSVTQPTCAQPNGSVIIANYDAQAVYLFSSDGLSAGAGGVVTGYTLNTAYTVRAVKNNCQSAAVPFILTNTSLDCDGDGITADEDPDDNDPCAPYKTDTPQLSVIQPSCGFATFGVTIDNFDAQAVYTFTPAGPTITTGGVVENFALNQAYTLTAKRNNCVSAPADFNLDNTSLDCDEDGVTADADPDDNDPCNPQKTADPLLNITQPTCTNSAGVVVISNFDANARYVFSSAGLQVDATGTVSGMAFNIGYTVYAEKNSCRSAMAAFTLANATLDCDGDGENADTDPDDQNPCIPVKTETPVLAVTQPTCASAQGSAVIGNFDPGAEYRFTPAGITVDASGHLTGYELNVSYSVTATNNSCTSETAAFTLTNGGLDCDGDGVPANEDPDDSDPCSPNGAAAAALSIIQPTCANPAGRVLIGNYDPAVSYQFEPAGPSVNSGGEVFGYTFGVEYTARVMKNQCLSAPASFILNASGNDCDGDGIPSDTDPDDNDPCNPNQTATPVVTVVNPTCAAAGTARIANFAVGTTYTFSPAGPAVDATGNITGFEPNVRYNVTAVSNNCISAAATFILAYYETDCDSDGIPTDQDPDDNNPCNPNQTATPVVVATNPTCAATGTARITNYVPGTVYTFTPAGPAVGASGNITRFSMNTEYSVTATLNNCTSSAGAAFVVSNTALDCDGDGLTEDQDPDDNDPCNPNRTPVPVVAVSNQTCHVAGTATVVNYTAGAVYTFSPAGPVVDASGKITGFALNQTYAVTAMQNNCVSATVTFRVSFSAQDCDGDGIPNEQDPDDNDPCNPNLTVTPVVTVTDPTCETPGTARIANFVAGTTYLFTPAGPAVDAAGNITGFALNTDYSVRAVRNNCASEGAATFRLSTAGLDCDQPVISIDPVNQTDPVTGKADPGIDVTVTFPDGTTQTVKTGDNGVWTVPNPGNLNPGDKVTAIGRDADGKQSDPVTAIVADNVPPVVTIDPVNQSDPVKGTADPGTDVTVTFPDGTTETVRTDETGKWTVPNPGNLNPGDEVTAVGKDPAGNVSDPVTAVVQDSTAPTITINPVNQTDPITGTADPGTEVTVTFPNGTTQTVITNEQGNWTTPNPGNLNGGDEVKAVGKDPAGNLSEPVMAIVTDNTPPVITINPVNQTDPITGTAEPGTEVTVTFPDGTKGTGIADEDGNWSVPNPGNLEPGDELGAVGTDPSGNKSDPVTVKLPERPAAPVINPLVEGATQITGTGTPGLTVVVMLPDGSKLTTLVKPDGTWLVSVNKPLEGGTTVTAVQQNEVGMMGPEDSETVTFKPLQVYNLLTPDGDGMNDVWIIDGIGAYPENEVLIFNRWNDLIVRIANYNNTTRVWKGLNRYGEVVPDGTYYYMITIKGFDKPLKGWIYLQRGFGR